MNKKEFHKLYPQIFFLEDNIELIDDYLKKRSILSSEEKVQKVEVAGNGNMNCTLRVCTNLQSLIVKQSRPWVEKYSHIPAPIGRTLVEGAFYKQVANSDIANMMPRLMDMDINSYILIFEDLGQANDFLFVYDGKIINTQQLDELTFYLANLHRSFCNLEATSLQNKEMRELNYEHIYHLPLIENNLDLDSITPGLQKLKEQYCSSKDYVAKVKNLGELYLKDGNTLLHGDYYPGSWLATNMGVRIIDTEFCFLGSVEFDMGVFVAHLLLAQQPHNYVIKFLAQYKKIHHFERELVFQFAGVEIMRRLLGVAQLPLKYGFSEKKKLLEISYGFIMGSTQITN